MFQWFKQLIKGDKKMANMSFQQIQWAQKLRRGGCDIEEISKRLRVPEEVVRKKLKLMDEVGDDLMNALGIRTHPGDICVDRHIEGHPLTIGLRFEARNWGF